MKTLHTLFPVTIMVLLCLCTDVSGSKSIGAATTAFDNISHGKTCIRRILFFMLDRQYSMGIF